MNRRARTLARAGGLALLAGTLLSSCSTEQPEAGGPELVEDGALVVAMSGEFQPFSHFEDNELTGFDHDIAEAVADEMGLELRTRTAPFDSLVGGIQADRYDVLIASMSPTEERERAVDFTDAYYLSGAQAFVAEGSDCTDPTALDSPSVGVATGTTYQEFLAGEDWPGEVRSFSSDVTALDDTEAGRLDMGITERLVGLYQIQEAQRALEPCGDPLYTEEPAFAVKQGNTALRQDLDEALDAIIADGTYAEISDRWFGTDVSEGITNSWDAADAEEQQDGLLDYAVRYAPLFAEGAVVTLQLTGVALALALVLGAGVAAAAASRVAPLRWLATAFIGLIRGTPLITQIFILYFGMAAVLTLPAFWAGSIALAIHNSAYIAEIFRSGFQSVPAGLVEASRSLGMSRRRTLRRVQAPLAFRTTLPVLGNQFIIALKDSSLVAFIGLTELFQTARNLTAQNYSTMEMYLIVAAYYLVIVLILTWVVHRLEHRLNAHRRPVA